MDRVLLGLLSLHLGKFVGVRPQLDAVGCKSHAVHTSLVLLDNHNQRVGKELTACLLQRVYPAQVGIRINGRQRRCGSSGGGVAEVRRIVHIQEHCVGTHKGGIAHLLVEGENRRAASEQGLSALVPVATQVTESHCGVLLVQNLDVTEHIHILALAIIVESVGPQLAGVGHNVGLVDKRIDLCLVVIDALVGGQDFFLCVPNVATGVETCLVGVGVVGQRVGLHLIVRVFELHLLDAHHKVLLGVEVTAIRLDGVVAVEHHTHTPILTYVVLGIELEVVGVEQGVAVAHLDKRRVDLRLVFESVVVGAVAIGIGAVLVQQHVLVALHIVVRVTDCAVAGDDRTIVVEGHVTHNTQSRRVGNLDGVHNVALDVDKFLLACVCLRSRLLCQGISAQQHSQQSKYGEQFFHRKFA